MPEARFLSPDALLEHAAFLRALAASLVRDPGLQDDAVQETWLAAIRRPPREGRVRGWLATVLRNAVRKRSRSDGRRRSREERSARPERTPGAGEGVARAEMLQRVVAAVCSLQPDQRDVVFLRFYEGLPPREIAARLDLPVNTVKSRLYRAVGALRDELEEDGDEWRGALCGLVGLSLPSSGATAMAAGTTIGVSAVGTKLKIGLGVLATCLLGLVAWQVVGSPQSAGEGQQDGATEMLSGVSEEETRPGLEVREDASSPTDEAPPDIPAVDLGSVDRLRDLHGVVVRKNGTPVHGARLQVYRYPWRERRVLASRAQINSTEDGLGTRSAVDGSFSIRLSRGYAGNLRVVAAGLAQISVPDVQAGERLRIVLGMAERLVVRAVAADGSPAVGVEVSVHAVGKPGALLVEEKGTTDGAGVSVFDTVPGGTHCAILLSHPDHGAAYEECTLEDSGETQFEHRFADARTLRGTVTDAQTGEPVVGAKVGVNWVAVPHVLTDAAGAYELPGWTGKGADDIAVLAAGYPHRAETVGNRDVIDFEISRGARIVGRIVGLRGPVGEGAVSAVASDRAGGGQRISYANAAIGEDGRFVLDGLAHDMAHTIVLIVDGYGRTLYDFDLPGEAGGTLDVGDLRLKMPQSIAGVVRDAVGSPVARVRVELLGSNADRTSTRSDKPPAQPYYGTRHRRHTDDLGRFQFSGLAAGTYQLTVRPEGARGIIQDVVLPMGEDVRNIEVRFATTRSIDVKVLDPSGKPVPGVFVTALGKGGVGGGQGRTGTDGVARMQVRPDVNRLRIYVIGSDTPYLVPQFKPVGPEEDAVEFRLKTAARITGQLVDPDGKPIAYAQLRAQQGEKALGPIQTDEEGRFTIQFEPPSTVSVFFEGQLRGSKYVALLGELRDLGSGADGVVLKARKIASDLDVHVFVLDPDGEPFEGAQVYAHPSVTFPNVFETDAQGRVHLRGLLDRPISVGMLRPLVEGKVLLAPPMVKLTPAGQDVTLQLIEGVMLEGTVYDADGKPRPGATVHARHDGRTVSGTTSGEDGSFSMAVDPETAGHLEIESFFHTRGGLLRTVVEGVDPGQGAVRLDLAPVR